VHTNFIALITASHLRVVVPAQLLSPAGRGPTSSDKRSTPPTANAFFTGTATYRSFFSQLGAATYLYSCM
jgi:hypothetical protein